MDNPVILLSDFLSLDSHLGLTTSANAEASDGGRKYLFSVTDERL